MDRRHYQEQRHTARDPGQGQCPTVQPGKKPTRLPKSYAVAVVVVRVRLLQLGCLSGMVPGTTWLTKRVDKDKGEYGRPLPPSCFSFDARDHDTIVIVEM
eukprot:scaffold630_cov174-Amphora_coffeaeformis.AAC.9